MSRQEDFKRMAHSHDTESSKYEQQCYIDGAEDGYEYARENLWFDAQGDIVPEYGREVIVIGRDGKVFYGHRPDPKEVTMVDGKPYHAKTYDKNDWNWPNIALWLDVEIPHEMVDKIASEYYKEKKQNDNLT